ncbi:FMN-binding negative transcriptional regulator [Brevundimonas sp.]|uniref:FMN-binding negative transcriptional regulator n=1 Tax=Brevundimonas sp. TaxID=1871086 RepID=UPI0035694748
MHYAEYKQRDPSLVREMIETFPFAAILANGENGPLVAEAPVTFRSGPRPAGAVEFHLARVNPVGASLAEGAPVSLLFRGPDAAVSPSWFTGSFQGEAPDRSRAAPTYNYLSLVLRGRLQLLGDDALQSQIADLVTANEPKDNGWSLDELAPDLWTAWRGVIQLYRIEIDDFELTAKFTPGEIPADRPGVVEGLRRRASRHDVMVAHFMDGADGSAEALRTRLRALRYPPAW